MKQFLSRITLAGEWHSFAQNVLPQNCSDAQRNGMKQAFYAGVWVMLLMNWRLGEEPFSEEDGVKFIQDLVREYRDYIKAETARDGIAIPPATLELFQSMIGD